MKAKGRRAGTRFADVLREHLAAKLCSVLLLAAPFSALATLDTWQELSSHVFTNTIIVWQVPTNSLRENFWVYHRRLPQVFSATTISNAMVLASLQKKGIPPPSANNFYIAEEKPPNYPGPIPTIFGIRPNDANLYFSVPHFRALQQNSISNETTIIRLARGCASKLGIDQKELRIQRFYTHWCDSEESTNLCGRGVFFPRELDGISFYCITDDGEGAEGFSVEFGADDKPQAFSLRWSHFERERKEPAASREDIIRCIKTHRSFVVPSLKEDYFAKLKELARVKKLTITGCSPYYQEGVFGEVPTNDVPSDFANPCMEMQGIAEIDNRKIAVRLLVPGLASDAARLLKIK